MNLAEYLHGNSDEMPSHGTAGKETDWLAFCELEIPTGSLWAGDPCIANPEDGCAFKVPAGLYTVEAKCMNFAGPKFVSRLRVFLKHAEKPTFGKEAGEAGTDSGAIGICDIQMLNNVIDSQYEQAQEQIERSINGNFGIVDLQFNGRCIMPYVASGFGDGVGPVFEIKSKRKRVGMELEFIAKGHRFEIAPQPPVDDRYARVAALIQAKACVQCSGTGKCYCLRKGNGDPSTCVRCSGAAVCHICKGTGKSKVGSIP